MEKKECAGNKKEKREKNSIKRRKNGLKSHLFLYIIKYKGCYLACSLEIHGK